LSHKAPAFPLELPKPPAPVRVHDAYPPGQLGTNVHFESPKGAAGPPVRLSPPSTRYEVWRTTGCLPGSSSLSTMPESLTAVSGPPRDFGGFCARSSA
jgi:hypothetical protein